MNCKQKGVCMRKIIILTLVMVFGLASVCFAGVEQGRSEIGGNLSRQSFEGMTMTMLNFYYGYFVTDEVQVTGNLMLMDMDGEATLRSTEVQGRYHFILEGEEYVPYVGGLLGSMTVEAGNFSETATSYGFLGGVKYFLDEDFSVNAEYVHKTITVSGESGTITMLTLGFAVYF